jgi:23S rRNA pseudouridine1911/1915/1917 synthase
VHRLDRDTSGVIVVARTDEAHAHLSAQFKARTVAKEYLAIVRGTPDRDADVVDRPIGDHPHIREQKAIREGHHSSKPALTKFEVIERFQKLSFIRALPKTGRTHQIRVHLASIKLPILCDKLYGGGDSITASELCGAPRPANEPPLLERQALHAHRLALDHPATGARMTWEAPLAADIEQVLCCLRR